MAGLAMVIACIYGFIFGVVYVPARGEFPWGFRPVSKGEGGLFWVVLAGYAFCGSVTSIFGAKDAWSNDI